MRILHSHIISQYILFGGIGTIVNTSSLGVDAGQVHQLITTLFNQALESGSVTARPGVKWIRDYAQQNDIKLVFASTTSRDVYHYCLDILQLDASDCLAIKDSNSGLLAAHSASVKCVAFPNEFTMQQSYEQALIQVDDLHQLNAKI